MSKRLPQSLAEGAWQLGLSVRVRGQVQVSDASSVKREGEKDHHRGMQGLLAQGQASASLQPGTWSLSLLSLGASLGK